MMNVGDERVRSSKPQCDGCKPGLLLELGCLLRLQRPPHGPGDATRCTVVFGGVRRKPMSPAIAWRIWDTAAWPTGSRLWSGSIGDGGGTLGALETEVRVQAWRARPSRS